MGFAHIYNWLLLLIIHTILFKILKTHNKIQDTALIKNISRKLFMLYSSLGCLFFAHWFLIRLINSAFLLFLISIISSLVMVAIGFNYIPQKWITRSDVIKLLPYCLFTMFFGALVYMVQQFWGLTIFSMFYLSDIYLLEFRWVFLVIVYCLFPAFSEELVFRGFLYDNLSKLFSVRTSIAISSILFFMTHLIWGQFLAILWLFPLGLVLGIVRSKNMNVLPSMILHFLYNFTIIFLSLI